MSLGVLGAFLIIGRRLERAAAIQSYRLVLQELRRSYLCGYSLFAMIETNFMQRFGEFNQEGFCYAFSAAIMLGLKNFQRSRLVRGHIALPDYDSYHSWVEIKLFGRWWVVDPCFCLGGFTKRRWYYHCHHPKIMVVYSYQDFWNDAAALQFHKRLIRPNLSKIFVDLYYHYTPYGDNIAIPDMQDDQLYLLDSKLYLIFPPSYGFKFSQGIINDFMARSTRRSPRRRSLRLLDSHYREIIRNQTPPA